MSDDMKKMAEEVKDILAKEGYPASDAELEYVAGGRKTFRPGIKDCKLCKKTIPYTATVCPYCNTHV